MRGIRVDWLGVFYAVRRRPIASSLPQRVEARSRWCTGRRPLELRPSVVHALPALALRQVIAERELAPLLPRFFPGRLRALRPDGRRHGDGDVTQRALGD